jgi:hypothetical protein
MVAIGGDRLLLTDSDIDALAWQFVNSDYAEQTYAEWPLDRRLDGFLRHRGLTRIAEDGDVYDRIVNRVMATLVRSAARIRTCNHKPSADGPTPGTRSER